MILVLFDLAIDGLEISRCCEFYYYCKYIAYMFCIYNLYKQSPREKCAQEPLAATQERDM